MIFNNGPAMKLAELCVRAAECSADKCTALNLLRAILILIRSNKEKERKRDREICERGIL